MNLKLFGLSASLLKSTLIVIVNVCENLANQNTWIVTCHLVNRVTIFENNMQCRNQVCVIQFSELFWNAWHHLAQALCACWVLGV